MKISEILTDKYILRIPPTVYYELLADVVEAEEEQEPCEDCVSRQAVLDVTKRELFMGDAISGIEKLPPVTPKLKTGRWIESNDIDFYKCSECGCHWEKGVVENCNMDFCPNCGAKMERYEDHSLDELMERANRLATTVYVKGMDY